MIKNQWFLLLFSLERKHVMKHVKRRFRETFKKHWFLLFVWTLSKCERSNENTGRLNENRASEEMFKKPLVFIAFLTYGDFKVVVETSPSKLNEN